MKKFNNLFKKIGFAAGTVAISVPLVLTSCSLNKMELMDIKDFDPTVIVKPIKQLSDSKSITSSKYYADEVAKNNDVLKNDILNAEQINYTKTEDQQIVEYYRIGLSSDIKIGSIDYWHGGYHYVWPTLSFTYSWDTKIGQNLSETNKKTQSSVYFVSKQTVKYENLPIVVHWHSDEPHGNWQVDSFLMDEEYRGHLAFMTGWSITSDVDFQQIYYQQDDDKKVIGQIEQDLDHKFVINTYREVMEIENILIDIYGSDRSATFFKLFTGALQFAPASMENVTVTE